MASLKKVTKTRRKRRDERKASERQKRAALKLKQRVEGEVNLEAVLAQASS